MLRADSAQDRHSLPVGLLDETEDDASPRFVIHLDDRGSVLGGTEPGVSGRDAAACSVAGYKASCIWRVIDHISMS